MKELAALGVDGGGTHSRAVLIAPSGKILGAGRAGLANYQSVGLNDCAKTLNHAVEEAWKNSGMSPRPADAAFIGCAGAGSKEANLHLREAAESIGMAPPGKLWVDHDLRIALAGALGGAPGVVIVVGTGSAAYGRNTQGESWRAGGWGWLMDDPGSGYWLGERALSAIVRAHDGRGPGTALEHAVFQALKLHSIHELTAKLYGANKLGTPGIAALAPIVARTAEEGDPVAVSIVREGCAELAHMVAAVAEKLGWHSGQFPVAAIGGVIRGGQYFSSTLKNTLASSVLLANFQKPIMPPVLGAAILAMQNAGERTEANFFATLNSQPETAELW